MWAWLRAGIAVATGLALAALLAWAAGDDPILVLRTMIASGFSDAYAFGTTLVYAAPLLCAGLSVGFAYRAGLLNIGGEGQLGVAALAALLVGAFLPCEPWLVRLLAFAAAVLAGALWAGIAGWIRTARGGHEVIATIMLNFVAASLLSWFVVDLIPNHATQNPESVPLPPQVAYTHLAWVDGANLSAISVLAIFAAILTYYWLTQTRHGFEITCVGRSPKAATVAGISPSGRQMQAMLVSGALAGLIGYLEVFGTSGTLRLGFSPGYGFMGIAVAFIARNNPLAMIPAALLFATLHKGSVDLEFETEHVSRELATIIQGLVVITVAAERLWAWRPDLGKGAQKHGN